MSWKNAFDDGACTVTVTVVVDGNLTDPGTRVMWSGPLAKDDSQNFADGGTNYTIAVDATGRISLSADSWSQGMQYDVDVAPTDMTGVIGGRLVDPMCATQNANPAAPYARRDGADDGAQIDALGGGG